MGCCLSIDSKLTELKANARIMNTDIEGASMVDQLNLHGGRFGHIISAFYAAYIVFEIPSNLLLKRFGPSAHISRIVIGWGIVTTCSAAVQSYEGMIVNRIALAIAEVCTNAGQILP